MADTECCEGRCWHMARHGRGGAVRDGTVGGGVMGGMVYGGTGHGAVGVDGSTATWSGTGAVRGGTGRYGGGG